MARYLIKRPHPAKTPMKAGQIVENPQWKHIDYLVSRGYVELVGDKPSVKKVEPQVEVEIETAVEVVETPASKPSTKKK